MGTRSTIAIQNADGTVTGIYCHWDGYLSHNGAILAENYADEAAVRELIALGDLSSLGEKIGNKVDFNDYESHNGQCVAYARDRGEQDVEAATHDNWDELLEAFGQEYDYLFVPGKGWCVRCFAGWENAVETLDEALAKDSEEA